MEAIDAIDHIQKSMKKHCVRWYRTASEGLADWLHLVASMVPHATPDDLSSVSGQAQYINALITVLGYDGVCALDDEAIADMYFDFDTAGTRVVDTPMGIHFVSNVRELLHKYAPEAEEA